MRWTERFPWWVRLALSVVTGFLVASWFSFLVSLALRSTNAGLLVTNLLFVWPVWVSGTRGIRQLWPLPPRYLRRLAAVGLALGIAVLMFAGHSGYQPLNGGLFARGYSWGDVALHMTLASFFSAMDRPILDLSLLANTKLTYPFLFDWQASLLLRMGASWVVALAVPAAALFLAGLALSYQLARTLLGSARAAGLHLVLFLGMGSAGGIVWWARDLFAQAPMWNKDYANLLELGLPFANPVNSHFLPQRTFLFGFAVVMAVLLLAHRCYTERLRAEWLLPAGLAGLAFCVHAHSALVASAAVAGLATLQAVQTRSLKPLLFVAGILGALALPQLAWQLQSPAAHTLTYRLGWMWDGTGTLAVFWLRQLGITVILIAVGLWLRWKLWRTPVLALLLVAALVIFTIGNLFWFHPNAFDNLKLMLYAFWAFLLPAAVAVDALSRTRWSLCAPLVVALACFTGTTAILRDVVVRPGFELFSKADLLAAEDLKTILPKDAVVATNLRHNSVVAALVGRQVVAGYTGWLWSYGLDWEGPADATESILQGADTGAFVEQYRVTHIAVSEQDQLDGKANLSLLQTKYQPVYTGHGWYVFATPLSER